VPAQNGSVSAARVGERRVYFGRASGGAQVLGWTATPLYDRAVLGAGAVVSGPAVLEQIDSTTVLGPGQQATVDSYGNLVVTRA